MRQDAGGEKAEIENGPLRIEIGNAICDDETGDLREFLGKRYVVFSLRAMLLASADFSETY